jgi:NAD(P)H-nitrite reductase large subunit
MPTVKNIVILGNGVAGVTAARFIRKNSDHRITIVSAESDHFFARTALMYIYMGHLTFEETKPYEDWFWKKNRIELVRGFVEAIDTKERRLHLGTAGTIGYDVLIIATGSRSNMFGWPGENLVGVQGLYTLQDLHAMELRTSDTTRAVIVGGGLIGIEMVEMLRSRHILVTFLVREQSYMDYLLPPEESALINDEIRDHDVDLRLGTELQEIRDDGRGFVGGVRTRAGQEIVCQFVGLAVGVRPNIGVVERSDIETRRGVLVNEYFETSVPGVYAIGDCAEFREPSIGHRPVEQLWYSARRHGRTLGLTIARGRKAYDKGVFFNSAKFFNVEYQTYGTVAPAEDNRTSTMVWQHPRERKLLRVNYDSRTRSVIGFNSLGVRLRHEPCERWIREGRAVQDVVANLKKACFDPEFSPRLQTTVQRAFESEPVNPSRSSFS